MRQQLNYHAGLAAEGAVERYYSARGAQMRHQRWRGRGGEVDLIASQNGELVFIEVKKSTTHAQAAQRLGRRQLQRIMAAAEEFLAGEPAGLLTPMRIDLALVNAAGEIEVIENAGMWA
ncbi:YraN family protein [Pseudoruegeria sp. SHC-113]|uniref:YraN family protein n=1 Tax=Pseudoruegeria sp. SHC-113 TaxID=2855439 RepID=UPI0021BB0502|nr:YraN family protein [Pseudoruegeria sp. SHC-113]MCT8161224.1 YraN family protein [Pseudoruegeria sp. SHC-113]